ncbi:hypothetical protein SESBI_37877 [Sesbania bispinosa]|nr:hypothetical protein SESBI_37877 [Sesbania bispinosa]
MDCNKEEALRAKDIAEKKMESRDFMGAHKFALKAQQLYPDLENIAQMLVVCDVHCSAEMKLFGNEMDWYEILQLERMANDAMIKKQYRKFPLQLHPDKNKFAGAEATFKLIGESQRVLLDREKRSQFDMKCRVPMNKTAMPFIAYNVDRKSTSSATNSSQQAFGQQKDGLNHDPSKMGGSQGNLHAEKSNTGLHEKKGPVDVSGKPHGKRKRNKVAEFGQSFDFTSSTDSEGGRVVGEDGAPGVENHSTYREEQLRRSARQKHKVSYKDNVSDNDDDLLRPSNRGKECGSPCGDGESHASKATNLPIAYVYFEAEFSDFDKDKKKECFVAGQIWAVYDTTHGMPRFYALTRKVLSPRFKLQITWLESHLGNNDEMKWVNEDMHVACGKYKLGDTNIVKDHMIFSHVVTCEKIGCNTFKVYPRKGGTWALFKNWDIKWYMDAESHKQYEYEFVKILSDYVDGEGVYIAHLAKFSHRIPSFKMTGQEGVDVPVGSYELDPAALLMNLEEIVVPENLDVSTPKVNLKRSNLAGNKDCVDDIDDCHAPPASTPEAIVDGLPKYYGQIDGIETSPHLELHVSWLAFCWLPENTTRWEDKDMVISCGRFKVNTRIDFLSVYSGPILLHTKCLLMLLATKRITPSFQGKGKSNEGSSVNLRIPRKELLRFSHRIPALKLTEEHGNLSGFWELDPGALPIHYYGLG